MPQQTLVRKQAEVGLDAGNTTTIELDRSHLYKRLNLVLDWDVTSAAGDGQSGAGILELIRSIKVEVNSQKNIKALGLPMLHWLTQYKYGTPPFSDAIDYASDTQQTGQVSAFLDFIHWPDDWTTALPAWETDALELHVHWGNAADIGVDTLNDATLRVESHEVPRARVPAHVVPKFGIFKEVERSKALTVTGETPIELPRGHPYRSVALAVFNNDLPSNTLVDSYELVEDEINVHRTTDFDLSRGQDKNEYGLESLVDGFTIVDFEKAAGLERIVPTKDMSQWELVLNTDQTAPTDPAEARVVSQQLLF